MGPLGAQIEEGTLDLRWGALSPGPSARRDTGPLPTRPPASPPLASRVREELGASPPIGGAGAGPERIGRGGSGTRG